MEYFGSDFVKKEVNSILKFCGMNENDKIGGIIHIALSIIFLFGVLIIIVLGVISIKNEFFPKTIDDKQSKQVSTNVMVQSGAILNLSLIDTKDTNLKTDIPSNNNETKIYVPPELKDGKLPEPKILFSLNQASQKGDDNLYHTGLTLVIGTTAGTGRPILDNLTPPDGIKCDFNNYFYSAGIVKTGPILNTVAYLFEMNCVSKKPIPFDENFPEFGVAFHSLPYSPFIKNK